MGVTLHFASDALLACRFAISPLYETMSAVRHLTRPSVRGRLPRALAAGHRTCPGDARPHTTGAAHPAPKLRTGFPQPSARNAEHDLRNGTGEVAGHAGRPSTTRGRPLPDATLRCHTTTRESNTQSTRRHGPRTVRGHVAHSLARARRTMVATDPPPPRSRHRLPLTPDRRHRTGGGTHRPAPTPDLVR